MEATLHVLKYIGGKGRMAGVLSRLIPALARYTLKCTAEVRRWLSTAESLM